MSIDIKECSSLTDDIIQIAVESHQFKNLKTLIIHGCHSFTNRGIDNFMTDRNPLEKIELINCQGFTHDKRMRWMRQKKKENWQVDVTVHYLEDFLSSDAFDSEEGSDGTSDSTSDMSSDPDDFEFEEMDQ